MTNDHRTTRSTLRAGVLWVCLLAFGTSGFAAPAPGDDKPVGEGLTRESLSDTSRPDPAQTRLPPLAPPPAAPAKPTVARTRATSPRVPVTTRRSAGSQRRRPLIVHNRRGPQLRQQPAPDPKIVVYSRPKRNPVVKFVYWWNGFVIRKFHTKIGTVFLGTVGADT